MTGPTIKPNVRRVAGVGLWAALSMASAAALAASPPPAPFAYQMRITPEEGPVDPAIERRYSPAFSACQAKAVTTLENADCFTREFALQDAALNRVWKATLSRLPASARKPLTAAQRQWIAARDPFCRTQSDAFSGGTIAPIVYVSCRVELTLRRTMWLEQLRAPAAGRP